MSPVKKIQLKIGRYTLKKERKKLQRQSVACNLESAKSIGILYNSTHREESELIKKLVIDLKQLKKEVLALGYVDLKDSSDIFKPHISYAYFSNGQLSKSFIPKSIDVTNFISTPYDLLIDLNMNNDFPLEYIATLSKAKFKVGATGTYRDNEFELTINIGENGSAKFLIDQIKHYLSMIKMK